jgi:hypothetical protein
MLETTTNTTYRGYVIEGEQRGRIWRVTAHPLHPDLPILGRHSLLRPSLQEAVADVRALIDRVLQA